MLPLDTSWAVSALHPTVNSRSTLQLNLSRLIDSRRGVAATMSTSYYSRIIMLGMLTCCAATATGYHLERKRVQSVQSLLDKCSQGHFGNGGEWHLQHASECGAFTTTRFPQHHGLWLHVAGDSTMRFFYAGLLSLFNGTAERSPGYPLHWLPSNDSCAFAKVGWPSQSTNRCYQRWRGRCHQGAKNGCWLDARGVRAGMMWRLTFEWWHHSGKSAALSTRLQLGTTLQSQNKSVPQAVYVGLGVWEALWNSKTSHAPSKEYAARLDSGLAQLSRLRDMLSAQSLLFILGNGGCRNQQPQWRHLMGPKTDFPGVEFERQVVVQGNAILEAFARNESAARGGGVLYLDRSAAMHGAKYMDTVSSLQSPCFHFHPYGVLTDVHVSLGLEALASYTLGGQGQDR